MAGRKGATHYSAALKEQAVRMVVEERRSHRAVAEALGIRDPDRIKKWMRAYRRGGLEALSRPQGRPRQPTGASAELERLRMENALLKKYHTELRQLALAKRNIG